MLGFKWSSTRWFKDSFNAWDRIYQWERLLFRQFPVLMKQEQMILTQILSPCKYRSIQVLQNFELDHPKTWSWKMQKKRCKSNIRQILCCRTLRTLATMTLMTSTRLMGELWSWWWQEWFIYNRSCVSVSQSVAKVIDCGLMLIEIYI